MKLTAKTFIKLISVSSGRHLAQVYVSLPNINKIVLRSTNNVLSISTVSKHGARERDSYHHHQNGGARERERERERERI